MYSLIRIGMTSVLACGVCLYVLSGIYSCNVIIVSFAMQCNAMRGGSGF